MIGVSMILVLLFALLTLVSYVDRLYQEIGKFLSREFQDNIDSFEQIVEPRLGVTRARASLSMAILTQLVTAAIAMIVGFTVFRDRAWSIYEVLEATLSLVLSSLSSIAFCPSSSFRAPSGRWLAAGPCFCASSSIWFCLSRWFSASASPSPRSPASTPMPNPKLPPKPSTP
jgi:putative hemolysin